MLVLYGWDFTGHTQLHTHIDTYDQPNSLNAKKTAGVGCKLDQIHRTPHSFHHLPRDHPVGQITATRYLHLYNIHIQRAKLSQNVSKMNFHLHGAQDSESNMSTSNHSKTLFTREEGAAWNCSHRLLPRVDQVRINLRKSINNVLDFFCTKRN